MKSVILRSLGLLLIWQDLEVSSTCPTNCSCFTSFSYVACAGQTYSTIPDNIPTDTETLKLVHNELVELDLPALYPLTGLKVLDVRGNGIIAIHGSFENFPFLREVYLGQNNLSTISPETFGNIFQQLKYIDLTGNPFNCQCISPYKCFKNDTTSESECDILWLQRQVHKNPDRVGRKVLCQSPDDLRGQFLDYVNISEPKCNDGNTDKVYSRTLDLNLLSTTAYTVYAVVAAVIVLVTFVHNTRNWATRHRRKCQSPLDDLSSRVDDANRTDVDMDEMSPEISGPAYDRNADRAEQHTDDDNETKLTPVVQPTSARKTTRPRCGH
ncbi:PREDICTED: slit homolog 2 protein-like isoform X2 [Branchiostoma belcheri]|nr:PREDICTED: slit homolog 2 protein-like isoform X2 [Branchiostoma belcheri]